MQIPVVGNSTPLIFLAKIGQLNLLEKMFEPVFIPHEVYIETVIKGKDRGYSDAFLIDKWVNEGVIVTKEIKIERLKDIPLGKGEQEAIELCLNLEFNDILMDDAKGRRVARLYGLKPKGTLWVLTKSFERDLLSKEDLKNSILELIRCGYRIREEILVEILKELI